ncbi:hypothetical protein Hdeb2414_s0024g00649991 [Helianthus debilis subsp. tardiflorus]
MSSDKQQSKPPPVIGKIGYYTVFVTPTAKPSPEPSPVQPPPVHYEKTAASYGSKFGFFWDAIATLQNVHSSLDDYLAHWFGLNQSKYQWALDDYYEHESTVSLQEAEIFFTKVMSFYDDFVRDSFFISLFLFVFGGSVQCCYFLLLTSGKG